MPADTAQAQRAWPWRRRRRLAGWAIGAAITATAAVLLLNQAVTPSLVWSHLGGTPVSVRGAGTNYWDRNGRCTGWVLPDQTPVPTRDMRGWHVVAHPDADSPDVQRVDIYSARQCVDGQYWAHRPGDHTLWARTPNKNELWHQFGVNLFFGYMLLGAALQAARGCRAVIRPDPAVKGKLTAESAWYQIPKGAGKHAAEKVAPDAQRAEPWLLPGPLSLAIFAGATAAALAALVIAFLVTDFTMFPAWTGVLALIAPFVVANGAISGNRRLSRAHRAKLRRHGVALAGEIVDCSRLSTLRPRSSRRIYWIILTVRFKDPEHPVPQSISRTYLFQEEPDPAAEFATRHRQGTEVTVYRSARKFWYVLDFEDDHLAWGQWW